uniref:Uncharacterized protein n=1 Tax=Panagrolaimus sp. ES5 TaxID=591445 RepID=A0AC34GJ18_9BILA
MGAKLSKDIVDFSIHPSISVAPKQRVLCGLESSHEFATNVNPLQFTDEDDGNISTPITDPSECVINFSKSPWYLTSQSSLDSTPSEPSPCFIHQRNLESKLQIVDQIPNTSAFLLKSKPKTKLQSWIECIP